MKQSSTFRSTYFSRLHQPFLYEGWAIVGSFRLPNKRDAERPGIFINFPLRSLGRSAVCSDRVRCQSPEEGPIRRTRTLPGLSTGNAGLSIGGAVQIIRRMGPRNRKILRSMCRRARTPFSAQRGFLHRPHRDRSVHLNSDSPFSGDHLVDSRLKSGIFLGARSVPSRT